MANFELDGLEELMGTLDNVLNQANSFEGKLVIDIKKIKKNIDSFNADFDTNFTIDSSEEDFQEYFQDEYVSLMQEHLTDNVDYKEHFNFVFLDYAHID